MGWTRLEDNVMTKVEIPVVMMKEKILGNA